MKDRTSSPASVVRIQGGCPDCDAFTVSTRIAPGVMRAVVHHDDTCPTLRQIEGNR